MGLKLNTAQIKARAKELLASAPEGIRWSELNRKIAQEAPETPKNTIQGSLHALLKDAPDIQKLSRGVYTLKSASLRSSEQFETPEPVPDVLPGAAEHAFYKPFAAWLKELDEVTEATVVGGNVLGGKWGTPDVIGVLRPRKADLIKFDAQIVSAEIKVDPNQPVVAFGQAVAYRLFSHRSFIAFPDTIAPANYDRLEALCILHGIGLVLFRLDAEDPDFQLKVRPQTALPDMFYVNEMAKRLNEHAPNDFELLF